MRGLIELPLEPGRKELAWYSGLALVNGTNGVSPTVALKVERDADFVVKRLFLVQWPTFGVSVDANLALPPQTTVTLRDGATKRALSLVGGSARNIADANPTRMLAQFLGEGCPYLVRANNLIFAEVNNPGAVGTAWLGDIYLVAEGYKVYPGLPEEFPATIKEYAILYKLNANGSIADPNAAAVNVSGQFITITNKGEGKFLAKGMRLRIIDAAGVDKTDALSPCLAFAITDTTSGSKRWNQDSSQDASQPLVPAAVWTMGGTFLPFNTPRYIDPNGVVQVQVIWSGIAAAIAYVHGAATFPLSVDIELVGALLPR
ncbi:MAG: hypothetical protein KGI98_15960 [Euryarchaeota archaeon]|nr:hypothetical protein [Euryarchaeota archaeon]MDE1882311.1 hypothetical protein [Euryarchaeota archaeon]